MAAPSGATEGGSRATSSRIYVPRIALGPVSRHMAVARGSQIIILGGAVSAQDSFPVTVVDLEREICIRPQCLGPAPPPQLVYATSSLVGDRIYIIGGKPSPTSDAIAVFSLDISGGGACAPAERALGNSLFCASDTFVWRAIPSTMGSGACLPSPRYKHSASVVRDREIWIVGGKDFAPFNSTIYSDVFKFDTVTRLWQRIQVSSFLPRNTFNHTAVAIKDRIWVFGGHNGRESTDALCSIRVDPPYQGTLESVPHGRAPERRACHAAISVGVKMYILGGRNGQKGDLGNMHELDTVSRTWRSANLSPDDQRLLKRSSHTASLIGKTVWLIGGQSDVGSPSEAIVGVRIPISDELASTGIHALFDRETMRQLVYLFNKHPREALDGIAAKLELPLGHTPPPEIVARFIRTSENLDKNVIGEFLGDGDEYSIAVLRGFVHTLDFSDIGFDVALRFFLSFFRPPGEAQKIERLMDAFGEKYFRDNKATIFHSPVAVSTLGYSVMMLNTDRHNPAVKQKMKHEAFIRNNRGMNGGQDYPREFLKALYYSIKSCPLQMGPDSKGLATATSMQAESKSSLSKFFFGPRRSVSPSRIPASEAALYGHISARQQGFRTSSMSSTALPSASSRRSTESHVDIPTASVASGSEEEGRHSGALSPVSVDGGAEGAGDGPAEFKADGTLPPPSQRPANHEDFNNPFADAESTPMSTAAALPSPSLPAEAPVMIDQPPPADVANQLHPPAAQPPEASAVIPDALSVDDVPPTALQLPVEVPTTPSSPPDLSPPPIPTVHPDPNTFEHESAPTTSTLDIDSFGLVRSASAPPSLHLAALLPVPESPRHTPEIITTPHSADHASSASRTNTAQQAELQRSMLDLNPELRVHDSPTSSRSATPDCDHRARHLTSDYGAPSLPAADAIPRSVSFMSDDLAVSFRTDPSHHMGPSVRSISTASSAPAPVSGLRDVDFNTTTTFNSIAQKLSALSAGIQNASTLFNSSRLGDTTLEAADGIERILSEEHEGGTATDKLVVANALESLASTLQHSMALDPKPCESAELAIGEFWRWQTKIRTELVPAVDRAAAAVSDLLAVLNRVSFGREEAARLAFCAEAETARRRSSPSFFEQHQAT